MTVGELLNLRMEQGDKSKNAIIREVGIDRSSFYKILSGERQATREQLAGILDAIEADRAFREQVIDTYEHEQSGDATCEMRATVREFLRGLSMKPLVETPSEAMISFVRDARAAGTQQYCAYLPVGSQCLSELFSILCEKAEDNAFPEICVLTAREEGTGQDVPMLQGFGRCFRYLRRQAVRFRAYSLPGMTSGLIDTVAFPYYILGEETVLLISGDETQVLEVPNAQMVEAFRENYERLIAQAEEVAGTVTGIQEMLEFFSSAWPVMAQDEVYILATRPCLAMHATEELVRKYMQDEYFVQYCKGVQSLQMRNFLYRSGIERLRDTCMIEEMGLNIKADPEDAEAVYNSIMERVGKDTFLLNEERVRIPDEWEINVAVHQMVVFAPYDNDDYLLLCKSREIVEPITEWCSSRVRELNSDILSR